MQFAPRLPGAAAMLAFVFVGVVLSSPARGADVVVLLSADVEEYQNAVKGFRDTTDYRITASYDMRGDVERGREFIRQIEAKDKPDLIYAVGIFALQAIAKERPKTPAIFAMVLNPPSILGDNVANITGVSMNVPVDQTFALLKQMNPSLKRVATVYNDQNTGFLIEKAKLVAKDMEIELVAKKADTERDAIRALDDLQKEKFDALWLVPDRMTLGPAFFEQALLLSFRQRIPLVGISKRHADSGAVVSLSFASSEDIGRQAGEIAGSLRSGKSAGDIPFTTVRKVQMIINLKTAQKLGIDVPDAMLKQASSVVR